MRVIFVDRCSYQVAKSYCGGQFIDGHSDWRLPTLREFYTIIARPVENHRKLFAYDYGILLNNYGCHWFLRDPEISDTVIGINLETGRLVSYTGLKQYLSMFTELECQAKCVKSLDVKTNN